MREKLEELLDLEREALDGLRAGGGARAGRAQARLPRSACRTACRRRWSSSRDYEFEDDEAAAEFEALLEELENMRALEEFQRRYGDLFHGPRALGYDEALELMREMERLKQLEEQLLAGTLEGVDASQLGELLGQQALRSFQHLQQMMLALAQAGYLTQREGGPQLSPKGVRKIGQLALRDIYQGLLRDRPGGHQTDTAASRAAPGRDQAVPLRRSAARSTWCAR